MKSLNLRRRSDRMPTAHSLPGAEGNGGGHVDRRLRIGYSTMRGIRRVGCKRHLWLARWRVCVRPLPAGRGDACEDGGGERVGVSTAGGFEALASPRSDCAAGLDRRQGEDERREQREKLHSSRLKCSMTLTRRFNMSHASYGCMHWNLLHEITRRPRDAVFRYGMLFSRTVSCSSPLLPPPRRYDEGVRKVAVTNAPRLNADLMLRALDLEGYFEHLVIGTECARAKPFPDPYLEGMRLVGAADPSRCVAFEDSPTGLGAAVAAGIPTARIQCATRWIPQCTREELSTSLTSRRSSSLLLLIFYNIIYKCLDKPERCDPRPQVGVMTSQPREALEGAG